MRRLTPIGALILLAAMVLTITQWADYDIFWHLANGRDMVEAGRFPSPDRYSWTMNGHTFIAYAAQLDRLFYLVWDAGGAPALSLMSAGLFALVLLPYTLLINRLGARPIVEAFVLLLLVLAIAPYRGARPHMAAFAIFGLLVYLLERPFGRAKVLLAGVALGAWANLHGTFYIGFGLLGAGVCSWLVARQYRSAAAAATALAIGGVLSLLSPYGLDLWSHPLQTANNPHLIYNADWLGMRPLTIENAAPGLLLLLAIAVGLRPLSDPRVLAAVGILLPAIQVGRFIPFAFPLIAFVALRRLLLLQPRLKLPLGSPVLSLSFSNRVRLGTSALLVCGTAMMLPQLQPTLEADKLAGRGALPVAAVDKLLACGEPGPLWNHYNWGGYIVWRGDGRYSVSMDGRAETLYSNQVLDDYFKIARRSTGWEALIAASPARYAVWPGDVEPAFDTLPGWRRVFADDTAIVSARDGAAWSCAEDRIGN